MAFFKSDEGQLLAAIERVSGPDFELRVELRDQYTYPVDGWFWFDTEAEARAALGVVGQGEDAA